MANESNIRRPVSGYIVGTIPDGALDWLASWIRTHASQKNAHHPHAQTAGSLLPAEQQ